MKRNIASLFYLIKEITPEKLTSSIQDTIRNSSNITDLPFKMTLNEITIFKENTQLLPRFHSEPIRSLIDKNLFEIEDALQKANEIVKELTQKAELVGNKNRAK